MKVAIFYSIIRKTGPKKKAKADMLRDAEIRECCQSLMASQVLVPSLFHKPVLQNDRASMLLGFMSLVSLLPSNKHTFCLNYIKLFLYYLQPRSPN